MDTKQRRDRHFHFDRYTSYHRNQYHEEDINSVGCCVTDDTLCLKQEVRAVDGWIKHIQTSGNRITHFANVNVSDHYQRWRYCLNFPDKYYCDLDLEGDANTNPPGTCGSDDCNVHDCWRHWRSSSADDTCDADRITYTHPVENDRSMQDPVCHITAQCDKDNGGTATATRNNIRIDLVKHLKNCDGTFKSRWC